MPKKLRLRIWQSSECVSLFYQEFQRGLFRCKTNLDPVFSLYWNQKQPVRDIRRKREKFWRGGKNLSNSERHKSNILKGFFLYFKLFLATDLFLCPWKHQKTSSFRSSHRRCFIKKAFLKNFAIFTGKHLC